MYLSETGRIPVNSLRMRGERPFYSFKTGHTVQVISTLPCSFGVNDKTANETGKVFTHPDTKRNLTFVILLCYHSGTSGRGDIVPTIRTETAEMDKTERRILTILDQNRERILAFGRDMYHHAELGYKEVRTSGRFLEQMKALGLETKSGVALTGVKAYLYARHPGPCLALLGEMDGLPVPDHPCANPETGAAHACGHHCQLTGVVGAATALSDPEVADALSGSVVFFGVPAEEFVDHSYRDQLIREGRIAYLGGKCELIRIGAFDDVDLCMAHHTANEISFGSSSANGFFRKKAFFYGRAAHAAAAPENGINALSAASLALQAIGMNRETFAERDGIRVNAVLTEGGTAPGIIPELACIEAMVRGKTLSAIEDASATVDRCLKAGALAMGAKIRIETRVGNLPEKAAAAPRELVDMAREVLPGGMYGMTPGRITSMDPRTWAICGRFCR